MNWRRKLAYSIRLTPKVVKYLSKIKDKKLKRLFTAFIFETIKSQPYNGSPKNGDLKGYFTRGFRYNKTDYRIAYTINDEGEIIIVVLTGSHERFYDKLKRL